MNMKNGVASCNKFSVQEWGFYRGGYLKNVNWIYLLSVWWDFIVSFILVGEVSMSNLCNVIKPPQDVVTWRHFSSIRRQAILCIDIVWLLVSYCFRIDVCSTSESPRACEVGSSLELLSSNPLQADIAVCMTLNVSGVVTDMTAEDDQSPTADPEHLINLFWSEHC